MNEVSGAQHVILGLMRESLMDKQVIAGTEAPVRAILPKLNVIQIGGLSIMDRGHTALLPLLDEIVANQGEHTQVVGVGPGVGARHILSVGLDLGLPTGALASATPSCHRRCTTAPRAARIPSTSRSKPSNAERAERQKP
jgi:molybdenum storage protein